MPIKTSLLYLLLLLATPFAIAENACTSNPHSKTFDETTTVRFIYDGDTLQLSDGRKVRLIGINTPELARKNKADEPFARQAKQALKALFKEDTSIALLYGEEQKDRYGRLLAHGFLSNGQNIQAKLLDQGLASAIAIPPNTRFSTCYFELEQKARCNQAGLWKGKKILDASRLTSHHIGFHFIQGKVKSIETNAKGVWLNIDDKLTIGIRSDNLPLFDLKTITHLLHRSIVVRGWVNKHKKSTPYYLRIRHPAAMQLSDDLICS